MKHIKLLNIAVDYRTPENEAINALKAFRKRAAQDNISTFELFSSTNHRALPSENIYRHMTFPFGRYKNCTFEEVSRINPGYIQLCLENLDEGSSLRINLKNYYEEDNK